MISCEYDCLSLGNFEFLLLFLVSLEMTALNLKLSNTWQKLSHLCHEKHLSYRSLFVAKIWKTKLVSSTKLASPLDSEN